MHKILQIITLILFCNAAFASSAAWYKWRSKEDGTIVCSQVPIGEGWEMIDGPYKDLQCRIAGKPG